MKVPVVWTLCPSWTRGRRGGAASQRWLGHSGAPAKACPRTAGPASMPIQRVPRVREGRDHGSQTVLRGACASDAGVETLVNGTRTSCGSMPRARRSRRRGRAVPCVRRGRDVVALAVAATAAGRDQHGAPWCLVRLLLALPGLPLLLQRLLSWLLLHALLRVLVFGRH